MKTAAKTAVVTAALLFSLSSFALAQGGGAGGAGGASGGSASSGSSATGGTNQAAPSNTGTNGQNSNNTQDQRTSPAQQQQQRNRGMGTAPNGLPVGAPGSGLGSPENPHDAGGQMERR